MPRIDRPRAPTPVLEQRPAAAPLAGETAVAGVTGAGPSAPSAFERARPVGGVVTGKSAVIGRAAVLGAGPAGLAQASLLLRRASSLGLTELTVVELRGAYTRPVGLSLRQTNLDALAWLNPDAYAELGKRSGITPGRPGPFLSGEHWDKHAQRFVDSNKPAGDGGDAARFQAALDDDVTSVAEHAQSMLAQPTMALVTLKDVEDCYWHGLEKLAQANGVKLRLVREHDVEVVRADDSGEVAVKVTPKGGGAAEALAPQDLVVVAQGVNCAVRRALGSPPGTPASPPDRYIAAVFDDAPTTSGVARSTYRQDVVVDDTTGETATVRLVRGRHARNGSHWCLAQVPADVRFTSSIDEISGEERVRLAAAVAPKVKGRAVVDADIVGQKVAEEVEAYFRTVHAKTGPADLPISYGPSLFTMQAKRFDGALLGTNAIAIGDAVGSSHFNVAGGAATGITTHTIAFDRFLETLATGGKREDAMNVLDRDLQQATLVWQLFGITQFEGDPATLRDTFYPKELVAKLLPPAMLDKYFPRDGGIPASDVNPAWHTWLSGGRPTKVPAHVVTGLIDATVARGAQVVPWVCDVPLATGD